MPITSVVTPWRTLGSWRGSESIINPGVGVEIDERAHDVAGGIDNPRGLDGPNISTQQLRTVSPSMPTAA